MKPPSLTELAASIDAQLKRLEAKQNQNQSERRPGFPGREFYRASACRRGRFVYVCRAAYQPGFHLSRDEAIRYLDSLAGGGK